MKARPDPSTKPYYRCLSCPRFRSICGGMPTRGMNLKEWCEYIRDVMDAFHLTNAVVAKEANVSIKTMERISALNDEQDIMRANARSIEVVVLGHVGECFCHRDRDDNASAELISKLIVEKEYLFKENERKSKIIDKLLG